MTNGQHYIDEDNDMYQRRKLLFRETEYVSGAFYNEPKTDEINYPSEAVYILYILEAYLRQN